MISDLNPFARPPFRCAVCRKAPTPYDHADWVSANYAMPGTEFFHVACRREVGRPVLTRVREAYAEASKRSAPTALYLGREEIRELGAEIMRWVQFESESGGPAQFMGMRLYEVRAKYHLKVV